MSGRDLIKNKRAYFDYTISEKFEAGIVLQGTEVKSLREHHGNLSDAYVTIRLNELWLVNAMIPHYKYGNIHNHEEKRARKLLMHRKEIEKLKRLTQEKGITILPLKIYFNKNRIKLEIGIGKGKKLHDKREALKKREQLKEAKEYL